jgi:RNA polymerase sigma factor (TIGR02999 family)
MSFMPEVTRLLEAIDGGDSQAAADLLPLVYNELRRLARAHMTNERAEHTLQATALVHEAYLRLIGDANTQWDGRGHFYVAAAEAMRRILIEHARSKNAQKRGGQHRRIDLDAEAPSIIAPESKLEDLLSLDEVLAKLETEAPAKAQLVKLRFFAGLTLEEAARVMKISPATAKRYWVYARAWLYNALDPPA